MNNLLKTLKRFPSFFKSRQRRGQFTDLPDDIIYEISCRLHVRSLCNLSLTCRQLYFALLFPHLRQLGFGDPFNEIRLCGENSADGLPALRLLLFSNPVKTLTWRAGNDPQSLVREAEELRRLIARIPSAEYLELDFSNNWPATESKYGHENTYRAWIRVCTNLLHVVAQKCHFVVITNHYQVLSPWLTFIGGKPYNLDDGLLTNICTAWREETKKVRLTSPSKISLSSPHTTRRQAFAPPFPPPHIIPGYTTARLIINDPGLFQRSLFGEWALKWVNMMPLTHFVIHQGRMRLPLLRQLRLPSLTHFTISRGYGLTATDVVQILQQNPALSSLDCLDTKLDSSGCIVVVKKLKQGCTTDSIGLSIERIKGPASFLSRVLDLELTFLNLTCFIVQLRDDAIHEQASLHRLYKAISLRKTISTLVFDLPARRETRHTKGFRLHHWLSRALGPEHGAATSEILSVLQSVKHVVLVHQNSSDAGLSFLGRGRSEGEFLESNSQLPQLLVKWLSMFPVVQEAAFSGIFDPPGGGRMVYEVVDGLRRVSPGISIRVDGIQVDTPARSGYIQNDEDVGGSYWAKGE